MIVLEGAAAVGQTAVSGSAVINGDPERSAVPSSTGLKQDPPVRADGRCALPSCGKPRHPERAFTYAREFALRDPFCSAVCAMRWHGVPTPDELRDERIERLAGARA